MTNENQASDVDTPNDEQTRRSSHCSSALWTGDRCSQLKRLEQLFRTIQGADKGSSFIRKFQEAESLVELLSEPVGEEKSFIQFLNEAAIESRRQYRDTYGQLPD